jgi:hypothetical protein
VVRDLVTYLVQVSAADAKLVGIEKHLTRDRVGVNQLMDELAEQFLFARYIFTGSRGCIPELCIKMVKQYYGRCHHSLGHLIEPVGRYKRTHALHIAGELCKGGKMLSAEMQHTPTLDRVIETHVYIYNQITQCQRRSCQHGTTEIVTALFACEYIERIDDEKHILAHCV